MKLDLGLVAAALLCAGPASAAECASDLAGLRQLAGDAWPAHWTEVGMDDGKPLSLAIEEGAGSLHLRFDKAGEGLWAEGSGLLCAEGGFLEMRFAPGGLRAGPAAHWLLRRAMQAGAKFRLSRAASGELRVRATGWSGRFVPAPRPPVSVTPA